MQAVLSITNPEDRITRCITGSPLFTPSPHLSTSYNLHYCFRSHTWSWYTPRCELKPRHYKQNIFLNYTQHRNILDITLLIFFLFLTGKKEDLCRLLSYSFLWMKLWRLSYGLMIMDWRANFSAVIGVVQTFYSNIPIYFHHRTDSEVIVFKKDDCEIYLLRLSSSEARNALRSTRHWTGKHI